MRRIEILDPAALEGLQIIKADHLAHLVRADDILSGAKAWASAHQANLAAELETERHAAYEVAYAAGLALFEDAVARYARETEALSARVTSVVRLCLQRVLTSLPSDAVLHDLIAPVLREIRSDPEVTIMVHPDRLTDLKAALARASGLVPDRVELTPRADAAIDPADCLIYTQEEVFSVSIPLVCDLLCRALSGAAGEEADDVG